MSMEITGVSKVFGAKPAVQDLSFRVQEGTVFGLLGLNGAGKSTTIRMILDILQPDAGQITWRGKEPAIAKSEFGYLPEERGLYQQMKVFAQLVFFGRLNGMSQGDAESAAKRWLQRFEIEEYAQKLVGELSKGNQQKVQFIAAILHNPALLVLDEPFSGLDPVNTSLFKAVFQELKAAGKTILFSSHRLDHVEELSDTVGIIHQSRMALEGNVEDILSTQSPQSVRMGGDIERIQALLPIGCPIQLHHGILEIPVQACNPHELLKSLLAADVLVTHFEFVRPTLNDVFLERVGRGA